MLDSGNKYIALFNEFQRAYPNLAMTGPTPVDIPYPTAACSQQLEGVAVFGAVVNPQGAIVASPRTIVLDWIMVFSTRPLKLRLLTLL